MGKIDLGKVRGTQIYAGPQVTGTGAQGEIFRETGISKAYEGDLYINTDSFSEDKGNIYECVLSGDAQTAKWRYQGNIRGPKINTVNHLKSTSTEEALSAYQGKRIFDMMKNAGMLSRDVIVKCDLTVYGLKVTIDNVDTEITLTIDGKEYKYIHTASGETETTKINIPLGINIGMEKNGGVLTEINSTNAYIYAYELTDVSASKIFTKNVELWNAINENEQSHEITGTVVDGGETISMGKIHKLVNGIKKRFYPVTHAKAVWFNKAENETVYDAVEKCLKGGFVIQDDAKITTTTLKFEVMGKIDIPIETSNIVVSPNMGLKIID